MSPALTLISHHLCPYVQRAVIALTEKKVAFDRIDIDLSNKPDWFLAISPLGKTPVLRTGDDAIFESAKSVDQKTMTLQYFETLKSVGMSPSTKYIFPMEFTSMLDNFLGKDGGKK